MTELEQYLANTNAFRASFYKLPPFDTVRDYKKILDKIDADLSPENLTCDGELPREEVQRRYRFLTKAREQLVDTVFG
jgi:hypothetical protein